MYKIIVVDDESFIRRAFSTFIDWNSLDCKIVGIAKDGLEALDLIETVSPDIVISDINMEKMDGIELIKRLNYDYPHIKCILLSGVYEFNNVYSGISYNVVDFILKPTSPTAIYHSITKAIYQIENDRGLKDAQEKLKEQYNKNKRIKQALSLTDCINTKPENISDILQKEHIFVEGFILANFEFFGEDIPEFCDYNNTSGLFSYFDLIFEEYKYYSTVFSNNNIQVLFNIKDESNKDSLFLLCDEFIKTINNLTDKTANIGLSRFSKSINNLALALRQSKQSLNFCLANESISILYFDDIPKQQNQLFEDARVYIDEIILSLKENHDFSEKTQNFSNFCIESGFYIHETRNVLNILCDLCVGMLWSYETPIATITEYRDNLSAKILATTQLEDIKDIMLEILMPVALYINENDNSNDIIQNAENFIKKNYMSELSLEIIAGNCHISTSYLSRLFKLKKNMNISTYIQMYRLEKAKFFLEKTDMKIYEIAIEVGIPDPVYFSKIFKKHTGIKIRDYRIANAK